MDFPGCRSRLNMYNPGIHWHLWHRYPIVDRSEQGGHCEQADVPDPGCGPGILRRWKNYVSEHKISICMNIYVKVFID